MVDKIYFEFVGNVSKVIQRLVNYRFLCLHAACDYRIPYGFHVKR